MVLARTTVGRPVCATAAANAAWILTASWPPRRRRSMSSSRRSATSAFSSSFWPKKTSRLKAPSLAERVWNWPSTVCAKARISAWPWSRANSTSQSRAPQALDHVPAGAREQRLELVDDPAVAAHRAVEPLQVAVDDEGAVVELLARGERERGDRLGLVHLAVAEEAPDAALRRAVRRREQAAVLQIAHEARLVDRVDRADAHRAGRELPEVGHQLRMRIRRQAARAARRRGQLLAIVGEVVGAEPAFEKGARIDARRRVRLEEDQVAELLAGSGRPSLTRVAEEMVEADLEEIGRRGIARDVAAELGRAAALDAVRAHHHRQRVPAHQRREALLHRQVAGKRRLRFERDRC